MKFLYLACIILALAACTGEKVTLDPVSFVKWVESPENGLLIEKDSGIYKFKLQYKPLEYLAVREIKKNQVSERAIEEKIANLRDMQYYTFQLGLADRTDILKSNVTGYTDFSQNIEYFSFGAQSDFKLIEGRDTLPCLLHHFERNFGVAPFVSIVLAFEEKNSSEDKKFVFDDQRLETGGVTLTILKKNIDNRPQLKTE